MTKILKKHKKTEENKMKKFDIMSKVNGNKVTRAISKGVQSTKKHSPLILAVVGGVGVVATAYFAYKAAPRVNEIVEDMERRRTIEARYLALSQIPAPRMTDEELKEVYELDNHPEQWMVDRFQVTKDLIGAVALPVTTAFVSLAAIGFSYKIMSGRVTALSTVVSALTAEKARQDSRLRTELDEETYKRITRPTETDTVEVKNEDGSTKIIEGEVKKSPKQLNGAFFSDSDEFVQDDLAYNLAWIKESEVKLDHLLGIRGFVLLNQVYDALRMERTKEGALMGWSVGDNFHLAVDQIDTMDRFGEDYTELFVKWPQPHYIYDDVDYEGRYSVVGEY